MCRSHIRVMSIIAYRPPQGQPAPLACRYTWLRVARGIASGFVWTHIIAL
jgi:hypothetical protein